MMKCFVTFCEDDAERTHVDFLVEELKMITGEKIKYCVFYKENFGDSLNNFMYGNMKECDCVLGLFGPEYKKRIDQSNQKSGAFIEYDILISRLNKKLPGPKPKLVPIHWSGPTIESAIPRLIMASNPYVCNLTEFRASGFVMKKPFLPDDIKVKYNNNITEIAKSLLLQENLASQAIKTRQSITLQKMLIDQDEKQIDEKLHIDDVLKLKFEEGKFTTEKFRTRLYTETRFIRRLKNRNIGLISGRKGSGKTTFVQTQEHDANEKNHFPVIDISVNNWNLHMLIQNHKFTQSEGDFSYIDLEENFLDFVWPLFTGLCITISIMYDNHKQNRIKSAGQLLTNGTVSREIDKLISDSGNIKKTRFDKLFEISVIYARKYIQSVVDEANSDSEDSFRLDVIANISISKALFSLFGYNFQRLRSTIQDLQNTDSSRKFLLGFDRFDTEIQKYRQNDNLMDKIAKSRNSVREVAWLSSLTKFVNKSVNHDRSSPNEAFYEFFSVIKFLVILPYDRVREIFDSQRDSITSEIVEEMHWQPKELLTMLRKRLQVLYNVLDADLDKNSNPKPEQRFSRCISQGKIPLPDKSHISMFRPA